MAVGAQLRPLLRSDRSALEGFRCRSFRQPWTVPIEEMVTEHLPDALHHVDALGLWDANLLVGVTAWSVVDGSFGTARSALVAVRTGKRRMGHGRRLKLASIERARSVGCTTMLSFVHVDNDAMIQLNTDLGARFEPIDGDADHLECRIDLEVSYG